MSDIVINGVTYPSPKRVALPGSDGKPVVFDLPEDADKGLSPNSERPVQNKVIYEAVQEIHRHLTSPYNFKGALASASALPAASAANANDTYYLIAEKYRVTSNGTSWEQSSMDESEYTDELATVESGLGKAARTAMLRDTGFLPVDWSIGATGRMINWTTGGTAGATGVDVTGYIDVHLFRRIRYARMRTTGTSASYGMAFYAQDKTFVGGERNVVGSETRGYDDKITTVPEGAYYARFNVYNAESYPDLDGMFYVSGRSRGAEASLLMDQGILTEADGLSISKAVNMHGGEYVNVSGGNLVLADNYFGTLSYITSCSPGDIFLLNAPINSDDLRAYGFLRAPAADYTGGWNLAAVSEPGALPSGGEFVTVVAPQGVDTAVFHVQQQGCVYRLGDWFKHLPKEREHLLSHVCREFDTMRWRKDYGYVASSGDKSSISTSGLYSASDLVDLDGFDAIVFSMVTLPESGNVGMCFFDAEEKYINGLKVENYGARTHINYMLEIPEGARYAGFTRAQGEEFYLYGLAYSEHSPFYSIIHGPTKPHLRWLTIGNSYSCDFVQYVPYILAQHGITCEVIHYKRDGLSLDDLVRRWDSTDAQDVEDSTLNVDGGQYHPGTRSRAAYYIDTRKNNYWYRYDPRVSAKDCVEQGGYDFITLQQFSGFVPWTSTYDPYLDQIFELIRQSIDRPTPIGLVGTWTRAPMASYSEQILEAQKAIAKAYPFDFFVPCMTATFNARTNADLAALGDNALYEPHHNLWCDDGVHLQDGIPRYIAALTFAQTILNRFFPGKSVLYDKLRVTEADLEAWAVRQQHLPVVGMTEANCLLAQKAAILAVNHPFEIVQM